jgi:hypothetical protein
MQWFLDDIHQPDWGVDVLSESYEVDLKNRIQSSLSNTKSEIEFITQKQKDLFDISLKNANEGLTAMNLK